MADFKRFDDPSTDNAKFKAGINDGKTGRYGRSELGGGYEKGTLGAPHRLTESGELRDSKMLRDEALQNGIPKRITGNPLGCTCSVAHLNAIGPTVDGTVEVDYTCDSGWHNYVVFEVRQYAQEGESGIRIDKFGNLVETEGFKAGELGEF